MNRERLRQIEELYHSAREREPAERNAFLAEACLNDEELLREVASLLSQDSAGGPLAEPVLQVATSMLANPPNPHLAVGTQVGPYEILTRLGEGGMGEVYGARDTRLGRTVAIKYIHEEFSSRFLLEARAISALNHPHICTLYDIGPDYLVMELVEGESLASRLQKGRLPMEFVLRYGAQIADALEAAHENGIIHQDLKPGNIMVTKSGIKVLDFGLAKFAPDQDYNGPEWDTATESRTIAGTPAYMAPEQLEGKKCDARTDIFALGLVLYEMAAGKRAFAGDSRAALVAEILHGQPPMLDEVPAGLQTVINKCLAKEPRDRYQSAADARTELEAVSPVLAGAPDFVHPSRRWVLAGASMATAIMASGIWLWRYRDHGPNGGIKALAVLPFEDLSHQPEQEFFADGLHQQLITDLSKIRALRVIARASVMRYRGASKPLPEIARELGVDGVVEGSVMRSGNRVRISARLIRARTESQLWAESYDRDLSEALAVQREAARTIAAEIRVAVRPEEKALLAAGRRVDPEVQDLVLRGQYWANKVREEDVYKAIDYFQQAIARDVNYAPAYSGLADCYRRLATAYRPPREVQPKAKAAAQRALELDETLVDAHLTLARVLIFFDWDWPAAEKHLKRAAELSPSSAEGHVEYASYFRALGQADRALTELRLAQALDPLSLSVETDLLFTLTAARQFDEVIAQAHRVLEREPNYAWGYAFAALAHGERGEFEQATEAIEMATKMEPNNTTITAFRAQVHAAKGNRREAERLIAELKAVSSHRYVCAYEVSHVYVKLGDKDEAFAWLEKGKRERAECMVWLRCEPWMDPLRGDRRYRELIEAIGLTGKVGSKP